MLHLDQGIENIARASAVLMQEYQVLYHPLPPPGPPLPFLHLEQSRRLFEKQESFLQTWISHVLARLTELETNLLQPAVDDTLECDHTE